MVAACSTSSVSPATTGSSRCAARSCSLERVQAAHANNVPLDLARWSAIQPCYGSEAYTAQYARWEARNDLADGSYDPGSRREAELRAAA